MFLSVLRMRQALDAVVTTFGVLVPERLSSRTTVRNLTSQRCSRVITLVGPKRGALDGRLPRIINRKFD